MKQYITLLLIALLVPVFSYAQEEDDDLEAYLGKFKSTEEDQYYHRGEDKEWKYMPFKPLKRSKVKRYKNSFFNFKKIKDYVPYEKQKDYHTPYYDSLRTVEDKRLKRYRDSLPEALYVPSDLFFHEPQYIGKIDRCSILKHERKGTIEAFIYEIGEMENGFGIWVAYSIDSGDNWSYYYTGITQKKPLYVKWYSNYPLLNSEGDLQIEACLMRKMSSGLFDAEYELVQDGLLLTFDLATLRRDSDGDGLTDILEKKYYTDLNNADTDGDGVPDNLDLNPRRAAPRTDKTIVYEVIVNSDKRIEECMWEDDTCTLIPLDEVTPVHYPTDSTQTYMIVSDDPNLISIQPTNDRIIFLSHTEYDAFEDDYKNALNEIDYSPLFKTDELENTYVFSHVSFMSYMLYYAKWTEKGWQIGGVMSIVDD